MELAVRREKGEKDRKRKGEVEEVEGAGRPHSLHSRDEEIGGRGSSALAPKDGREGAAPPHSSLEKVGRRRVRLVLTRS